MADVEACQVQVTVPDREAAVALARDAVARRLAACVQIGGPVLSVYRWREAVEEAQEWTVTFKTTLSRYPGLAEFIGAHHSYEVPEIICLPIAGGNAAYLAWLAESVN